MKKLYVKPLRESSKFPVKATDYAACFDVFANLSGPEKVKTFDAYNKPVTQGTFDEPIRLYSGDRVLVPTGLIVTCDIGYCIKAYARSGLAIKNGLTLINCVGIIDADYRNELFIPLVNTSMVTQTIEQGDRIAQIMVEKLDDTVIIADTLPPINSNRNGGFGHTGIK